MLIHGPPSVSTSSSSESSTAPMDFNVCHSLESSRRSPRVRLCQTCRQMRRSFTCADCVRVGDFSHSRALFKESFSCKKMKLSEREREKHRYAALIEEGSQPHRLRDEIRQFNVLARQRAETRTRIIAGYSREITQAEVDIIDIQKKCKEIREKRNTLPNRKKICIHETKRLRNQIEELNSRLKKASGDIVEKAREHVQDLRTCIFPIAEIRVPNAGSRGAEQKHEEVAELEDAFCTNYIRGKWVYSNRSIDETYTIVAPCLPADGNYGVLTEWVQQRQDQNPVARDEMQEPAFEIAAGLMHLTQMVRELAFFIDLRLPYAMCFSEFSAESLTENGLANKIAKLNGNVVYICASQNLDATLIQSRQTVRNILNILDHSDFPRIQGFELNSTLTQSIEDTFTQHLRLFDMHAEKELAGDSSAPSRDTKEDDCEWEIVASTGSASSPSFDQSYACSTVSALGRPSITSESILTSAAAIMSSWFSTSMSQRKN